jgi:hypothetical protein
MLSFDDKIKLFQNTLEIKNGNYADDIKDEIFFYFFENERSFHFLNLLKSEDDIIKKVDFLVSKIIMHEHQEGINTLIEQYT